jgi:hypothetical protein
MCVKVVMQSSMKDIYLSLGPNFMIKQLNGKYISLIMKEFIVHRTVKVMSGFSIIQVVFTPHTIPRELW